MSRNYLGASAWSSCDRIMWLKFRKAIAFPISEKLQRTFDIGHALEPIMIKHLTNHGLDVGLCEAEVVGKWGQVLGHVDGVVKIGDGSLMLLEMKTANDSRFKDMMKNGLPDYYYAQIQIYMHHSDQIVSSVPKLTSCHYMILNKNTSELFETAINYDPEYAERETERMHDVISSEAMPAGNKSYKCNFCDARYFCSRMDSEPLILPEVTCGTCAQVSIVDGQMECPNGAGKPCGDHIIHPQILEQLGYEYISANQSTRMIEFQDFVLAPEGIKHASKPTFTSVEWLQNATS